ncbi:DNA (cytosine-5-)-methyltransferase [Vagococcus penaei]|nr:DNA (cytosine-5-)-methyltransferase [Vagococcus penaei]
MIKFIDLFAGMGGIRIGFEKAAANLNIETKSVFVSEIKKHAISAYSDNFNETIHGDITAINAKAIPDFDILLAGFPCQAFSNAGNRLGFDDTRGTLFFDVARILKEKQPYGFILENVEGLVSHDKGNTFRVITNVLDALEYNVSYKVLDSQNFGLAQSRKRIYIVGTKGKKVDLNSFKKKESILNDVLEFDVKPIDCEFSEKLLSHFSLSDVIGKQIKDKRGGENNIHSWDFELKGEVTEDQKELLELLLRQRRNRKWAEVIGIDWMDGMPLTKEMIETFYDNPNLEEMLEDLTKKEYLVYEHPKQKINGRRVYDTSLEKGYNIVTGKLSFKYNRILDGHAVTPTLVATDVSKLGVAVQDGIRPLTIREGLRLFGFPEEYKLDLPKSKAYDLLGNTVAVPVIEAISTELLKNYKA